MHFLVRLLSTWPVALALAREGSTLRGLQVLYGRRHAWKLQSWLTWLPTDCLKILTVISIIIIILLLLLLLFLLLLL